MRLVRAPSVFRQSRRIILGKVVRGKAGYPLDEAARHMSGEVRPGPAPSCPPWGLHGVAQSHLLSSADGWLTARFCIVLLRNLNVQSVKQGIKALTLAFNYYFNFFKRGVAVRIKYLEGIKYSLSTFSSSLVFAQLELPGLPRSG